MRTQQGTDFVSLLFCFSEWGTIPAGVPQGTKLGPWLFAIMINDIKVNGGAMLWKYVDDTKISEIIPRGQLGGIQAVVDDLSSQSQRERFKLNEAKCKELRDQLRQELSRQLRSYSC